MQKTARKGDWIQTYTGKVFWSLDPRPEDINELDIAHSLSLLCRYVGHCKEFYSVAQHSCLVHHYLEETGYERDLVTLFWGLMHDAAEAYTNDIARPLKKFVRINGQSYSDVEDTILACIAERFDVPLPISWGPIKRVDDILLATEARDLMNACESRWSEWFYQIVPLEEKIVPLDCASSEKLFLETFKSIMSRIKE